MKKKSVRRTRVRKGKIKTIAENRKKKKGGNNR